MDTARLFAWRLRLARAALRGRAGAPPGSSWRWRQRRREPAAALVGLDARPGRCPETAAWAPLALFAALHATFVLSLMRDTAAPSGISSSRRTCPCCSPRGRRAGPGRPQGAGGARRRGGVPGHGGAAGPARLRARGRGAAGLLRRRAGGARGAALRDGGGRLRLALLLAPVVPPARAPGVAPGRGRLLAGGVARPGVAQRGGGRRGLGAESAPRAPRWWAGRQPRRRAAGRRARCWPWPDRDGSPAGPLALLLAAVLAAAAVLFAVARGFPLAWQRAQVLDRRARRTAPAPPRASGRPALAGAATRPAPLRAPAPGSRWRPPSRAATPGSSAAIPISSGTWPCCSSCPRCCRSPSSRCWASTRSGSPCRRSSSSPPSWATTWAAAPSRSSGRRGRGSSPPARPARDPGGAGRGGMGLRHVARRGRGRGGVDRAAPERARRVGSARGRVGPVQHHPAAGLAAGLYLGRADWRHPRQMLDLGGGSCSSPSCSCSRSGSWCRSPRRRGGGPERGRALSPGVGRGHRAGGRRPVAGARDAAAGRFEGLR